MLLKHLTLILVFLSIGKYTLAQNIVTFYTTNGRTFFNTSSEAIDSLVETMLQTNKQLYLDLQNDLDPIVVPRICLYINIRSTNEIDIKSAESLFLYDSLRNLKFDIFLDSNSVLLDNGDWLVYTIYSEDTTFELSRKFQIQNNRLNGTYFEYDKINHIEKRKYDNGVLIDSLVRINNGNVYLLLIRSKSGKLISGTRYFDSNYSKINIFEDYILKVGLGYDEQTRLIEIYNLDESNEFPIIYNVDKYGRVLHPEE